jgi:hypothetical protein
MMPSVNMTGRHDEPTGRTERDRAIFLGIVALQDIADQAAFEPIAPTIQLRALLALVSLHGRGDLQSYKDFWQTCQRPYRTGHHAGGQNYERGLYTDIALKGIVRGLGIEPQNGDLTDAIRRILGPNRKERCQPEYRTKRGECGWL